jgi:PAS domain S-box-containing protein
LTAGGLLWVMTLILPLFARAGWLQDSLLQAVMIPMSSTDSAQWTLMLNASLFVLVSLLRPQNADERRAAEACIGQSLQASQAIPHASTLQQFESRLAEITGPEMAAKEVNLALQDLGLEGQSLGRGELARLRQQIRHNLSGLVGPVLANMVVTEQLEVDGNARMAIADTIRFVEKSLAGSRLELKEMAGELDALRRFHRQVLHDLPLAVVTVSAELQVASWNAAMERLSGFGGDSVLGRQLSALPAPWNRLLVDFIEQDQPVQRGLKQKLSDGLRVLNLFKSALQGRQDEGHHGFVIVIEDHSEISQLEMELAHSERLASIGRLATGVAHEIGNPVTGIACLAQDLKAEPENRAFVDEGLDDILKLTRRISTIVQSLVRYSHAGAGLEHRPQPVRIPELVDEAIRLVSLSRKGKQIGFRVAGEGGAEVHGDYQKLLQLLVNLLTNAVDASAEGASVSIDWRGRGGELVLRVIDQGHGMEPQQISRIYDPFFTTKKAGEGTGLGLTLAWGIVRDHGGRIEVHSQPGEGSEFIVTLKQRETAGDE